MIFVADAAGHCVHIGREWHALTGQPIAQALGRGWTSRVHPDDLSVVQRVIETAAATASEFSLRYRILRASSHPCWVMVGCIPSFSPPDATFLGYLGTLNKLADGAVREMQAYGNVGRYVPPPTHDLTAPADHLDQIADYLILAHSLIEGDGAKSALPGVRQALFEVGRALAAREDGQRTIN